MRRSHRVLERVLLRTPYSFFEEADQILWKGSVRWPSRFANLSLHGLVLLRTVSVLVRADHVPSLGLSGARSSPLPFQLEGRRATIAGGVPSPGTIAVVVGDESEDAPSSR